MKAQTIFYNGSVHTVDRENSVCEAVAVFDGRIMATGATADIMRLAGSETETIDLAGRSLIPGVIDAHEHTAVRGLNANGIDCRPSSVKSIEDIKALVREAARQTPKGQWIRGWGYNDTFLAEKRHPNRWDLDEAAPDHPVVLTRTCAHISAHNSKSLAVSGVSEDSEAPEGGAFERIDGKISGVMLENAHMMMMKPSLPTKEELIEAMDKVSGMLIEEGITSVHDSGAYGPVQMAAMQEASASGRMKPRLNVMIFSFIENTKFVSDMLDAGFYSGLGNDRFRLGPIKLMIDGSSSGPTAATLTPYDSNPNSCGIMSMEPDEIERIVLRAHQQGWQLTCHAVGDKAIGTILTAYEKALSACPRKDHRHRIEHCAMMNPELMARIKSLGIVPIPQPIFLYEFGDGYVKNYGPTRGGNMFPSAGFLQNGVIAAGSSDCPITFSNPFLNMYVAVNRKTQSGNIINEEECVSIQDALRMFTWNGAYASFEEDIKGSVEPGKLADLVVLSDDLCNISKEALKDVRAELTMIGGEIVYRR